MYRATGGGYQPPHRVFVQALIHVQHPVRRWDRTNSRLRGITLAAAAPAAPCGYHPAVPLAIFSLSPGPYCPTVSPKLPTHTRSAMPWGSQSIPSASAPSSSSSAIKLVKTHDTIQCFHPTKLHRGSRLITLSWNRQSATGSGLTPDGGTWSILAKRGCISDADGSIVQSWSFQRHGKPVAFADPVKIPIPEGQILVTSRQDIVLEYQGDTIQLGMGAQYVPKATLRATATAGLSPVLPVALAQSQNWALPQFSASGRELKAASLGTRPSISAVMELADSSAAQIRHFGTTKQAQRFVGRERRRLQARARALRIAATEPAPGHAMTVRGTPRDSPRGSPAQPALPRLAIQALHSCLRGSTTAASARQIADAVSPALSSMGATTAQLSSSAARSSGAAAPLSRAQPHGQRAAVRARRSAAEAQELLNMEPGRRAYVLLGHAGARANMAAAAALRPLATQHMVMACITADLNKASQYTAGARLPVVLELSRDMPRVPLHVASMFAPAETGAIAAWDSASVQAWINR